MEQVNGIQNYVHQMRNVPLLTKEQEIELTLKYQAGDKKAKDKLVIANLRLVAMAAKSYSTYASMSFEDLLQEGTLGLIRSVETFDTEKGYRFSTYAMYWIKQAISRALANNAKTIRIPVHIIELKAKYRKAQNELKKTLQREPTVEEIAQKMSMDVNKIKEIEITTREPISLSTTIGEEENNTVEDLIPDRTLPNLDEELDNEIRAKTIFKVLSTLNEREQKVLIARYGLGGTRAKTLEEVGAMLNLTKERIRQIEQNALHKMRHPLRANILRAHL